MTSNEAPSEFAVLVLHVYSVHPIPDEFELVVRVCILAA